MSGGRPGETSGANVRLFVYKVTRDWVLDNYPRSRGQLQDKRMVDSVSTPWPLLPLQPLHSKYKRCRAEVPRPGTRAGITTSRQQGSAVAAEG